MNARIVVLPLTLLLLSSGRSDAGVAPFPGQARYSHSVAFDQSSRELYVFGGASDAVTAVQRLSDLWVYSFETNRWSMIEQLPLEAPRPLPRFGASLVHFPEGSSLVLYSGNTGGGLGACLNDRWTLHPDSALWRQGGGVPAVAGRSFAGAASLCDQRAYFTFGDCGSEATRSVISVGFNQDDWVAHPIPDEVEERTKHVTVADTRRNRLLITSGNAPLRVLFPGQEVEWRKVWAFDPITEDWTALTDGLSGPGNLTYAAAAYDRVGDALLIFGGRRRDGTLSSELWSLDLETDIWRMLPQPDTTMRRMATGVAYCPCEGGLAVIGGRDVPLGMPGALTDFRILPVQESAEFEWKPRARVPRFSGKPLPGRVGRLRGWPDNTEVDLVDCRSGARVGDIRLERRGAQDDFMVFVDKWTWQAGQSARMGTLRLVGKTSEGRSYIAKVPSPPGGGTVAELALGASDGVNLTASYSGFHLECKLNCQGAEHKVQVFDVRGRRVFTDSFIHSGTSGVGRYEWSGLRSDGGRAQAGSYYVRVEGATAPIRLSFIKLR